METKRLSLTNKCQGSVERRVLDLESEAMRGLGSIPAGGGGITFFTRFFLFSNCKDENANIGISVRM